MSDQEAHDFKHFSPQISLLICLEQPQIKFDELLLEEFIGDIRILDDTFEIAHNIVLLVSNHAIKNESKFFLHFVIDDSLCHCFRIDVLKSKSFFVKFKGLYNLYIFIPYDWLDCIVRLMVDYFR